MSQLVGIIANQRFLGKTNPIMTAAVADGGSVQDREYIQRAARGIVDAGHWSNLKFWGVSGLAKLRNSGGVDYVPKLYDLSGNGNDGAQTTEAYQPVYTSLGLDFDGSDDRIVIAQDTSFNSDACTMMGWVYINSKTSTFGRIISSATGTNLLDIKRSLNFNFGNADQFQVLVNDGGVNIITISRGGSPDIETWYHFASTYTADGDIAIYINGSLSGAVLETGRTVLQNPGDFQIGNMTDFAARPFDGIINDARYYTIALTATEIAVIYNQTSYRYA